MKQAILPAAAALALGACQSEEPAAEATEAAAAEAAEPAEPAAAAPAAAAAFTAGQPPSAEFMVGTWGEGDACDMPIQFEAGGTIKDGPFATWTLADGQLVMDDLVKLRLTVVDAETMESLAEGSTQPRTLKRCG